MTTGWPLPENSPSRDCGPGMTRNQLGPLRKGDSRTCRFTSETYALQLPHPVATPAACSTANSQPEPNCALTPRKRSRHGPLHGAATSPAPRIALGTGETVLACLRILLPPRRYAP